MKGDVKMGVFDENLEKRVWERVQSQAPAAPLQSLAAAEANLAAVYLRLARMCQGPQKTTLRRLWEGERSHSRCLGGMGRAQGKPLSVRTAAPAGDPMEVALRKCYVQTLRAMTEYESRREDKEFGHIFARMAREEAHHCRMILELLGE